MSGNGQRGVVRRVVSVILDKFPTIGEIKQHDFTASDNAKVTFTKSTNGTVPGYYIVQPSTTQYWNIPEMRELAEELTMLADHLEKFENSKKK